MKSKDMKPGMIVAVKPKLATSVYRMRLVEPTGWRERDHWQQMRAKKEGTDDAPHYKSPGGPYALVEKIRGEEQPPFCTKDGKLLVLPQQVLGPWDEYDSKQKIIQADVEQRRREQKERAEASERRRGALQKRVQVIIGGDARVALNDHYGAYYSIHNDVLEKLLEAAEGKR